MYRQLVFIFFLLPLFTFSQNRVADSLLSVLKKSPDDTMKVLLLSRISGHFISTSSYEEAIQHAKTGTELAEKLGYEKGVVLSKINHAWALANIADYTTSKQILSRVIELAEKKGYQKELSHAYQLTGNIHFWQAQYPEAMDCYTKSLKIAEKINDKNLEASCYNMISAVNMQIKDYNEAILYAEKALRLAEEIKDERLISSVHNKLGGIYYYQQKFEKALSHFLIMADLNEKTGSRKNISQNYGNIGGVYRHLSQINKAIEYYNKQLFICREINDKEGIMEGLLNLGLCYNDLGRYKESIEYYTQAIQLSRESGSAETFIATIQASADAYYNMGNYKSAFDFYERFKLASDSVFTIEKSRLINEIRIKYEADKNARENLLLLKTNEIQQQQLKQRSIYITALVTLLIVVLLIAWLLFRQKQLKNAQKSLQLEQKLLRTQMNPHFIFNSLIAIESYIYDNEPEKAGAYLSRFAQLMRQTLESSAKDYISLEKEIKSLNNYLALQQLRFENTFEYSIELDENIDASSVLIPPMLTQPFIENAIEHGFKKKQDAGKLKISFKLINNVLHGEVVDNGIGLNQSRELSGANYSLHQSMGLSITKERLRLLNKGIRKKINLNISELKKDGFVTGTGVYFSIPLTR